jgi:hypothetical protein
MPYVEYDEASKMEGPFPLRKSVIAALPESLGVYLLASHSNGTMLVRYVGRTDRRTLSDRLLEHLSEGYGHFYFVTTRSELESFKVECAEFHAYGKADDLDNIDHPARPPGYSGKKCAERNCTGEPYQ